MNGTLELLDGSQIDEGLTNVEVRSKDLQEPPEINTVEFYSDLVEGEQSRFRFRVTQEGAWVGDGSASYYLGIAYYEFKLVGDDGSALNFFVDSGHFEGWIDWVDYTVPGWLGEDPYLEIVVVNTSDLSSVIQLPLDIQLIGE